MDESALSELWEAIYQMRLKLDGIEALLLYNKTDAFAGAHEALLQHVARLTDSPRKRGALSSFDQCAIKNAAARRLRSCIQNGNSERSAC